MSLAPRSRIRELPTRRLDLPPPFSLVVLREVGDSFAHACAQAHALGAGALVFVGRFDLAEFAVVLEPEQPLATARLVFYAGMVALADALAAQAPPEKPIQIDWPDACRVDGGLVGGGRLAWPEGTAEASVPDWLVFGAAIRTVNLATDAAFNPLATALADEGFQDVDSGHFVESFARHFMLALDRWQEGGFAPLAAEYLAKLKPEPNAPADIDGNGDLAIRRSAAQLERRALLPALAHPSWLDPETRGPRL